MAIKLRYLDTAKGLTPGELELINYDLWLIEQGLNSVGAATPLVPGSGTPPISDHHLLTNLTTFDDHPQYAYLAGRVGGQRLIGGSIGGFKIAPLQAVPDGANPDIEFGNAAAGVIKIDPPSTHGGGYLFIKLDGNLSGIGSTQYLNCTEVGSHRVNLADYGSQFYGDGASTGIFFYRGVVAGLEYHVIIAAAGATTIPLIIKGFTSQSANLTEWRTIGSPGTELGKIDKDGYATFPRLSLPGSTSGILTHIPAAVTTSYSLIWPAADAVGVLTSDGAGNLSWAAGVGSVEFADNVFRIYDDGTVTKKLAFQCSGITAATTRTWTVQNTSGTVALLNGGLTQNWASTQNFLGAVIVSDTLFTLNDAGLINSLQFITTQPGIVVDSPASSGVMALLSDIFITVRRNTGADIGSRPRLNFIEGTDIALTITDDGVSNEIDITIESTAGGGAGSFVLAETEKNLGANPNKGGTFDITGLSSLTADKQVLITQKAAPFTGKGTLKDHGEMDHVLVTAYVLNATTIRAHWFSPTYVQGNFKFGYVVSG